MNNKTLKAIMDLLKETFESDQRATACDLVTVALTAKFEMKDILQSLEDATSVYDVYEATEDYQKITKRRLETEEVRCDSVFKRIFGDVAYERFYDEVV